MASSSSSSLTLHSIAIVSESDSPPPQMDPNHSDFPLLSFVLSQLSPAGESPEFLQHLLTQFPHLSHSTVFSAVAQSLPPQIAQIHSLLRSLGPRPDPSVVSTARSRVSDLQQSGKEEAEIYMAVLRMEDMHQAYERQLRDAEQLLVEVYRSVVAEMETDGEVDEEVVGILKKAESETVDRVELSGRQLKFLPEAFGKLHGLVVLNLSQNQLEVIPDSIAGLQKLEELDISSNLLKSLPDSIGLLLNLRVLNVSGNKLNALPESISRCCSLVELDASFNYLTCLPTTIGYGLVNLERLSIYLNKIRALPQSICEMRSLRFLDAHFNEIHGLPSAIGRLTNLEVLNVSSNFSDFTEVPETICDLTNLLELDLSNNQIKTLPDTFFRLEKLSKLNLEQNPLVIPPMDVVNKGVEAVREFMAKRWADIVAEEQRRMVEATNNQQAAQSGWLAWATSLLTVPKSVAVYLGGEKKAPSDSYLDQQL